MTKRNAIELAEEETTDLVPLTEDPSSITDLIATNLGGEMLTPGDLDRAINPSGKSTKWEIPDIDGDSEATSVLTGVIIHSSNKRAYYAEKYSGGNERPDCFSDDGIHGQGTMADKCGGLCENCPMNEFGTAEKGKGEGKACKEVKRIYLLREGELLPMILNLTPMNRRTLKKYGVALMNKRRRKLYEVLSKFSLSTDKAPSGYDYAKVTISLVSELSPPDREKMAMYVSSIAPALEQMTIEMESRDEVYGKYDDENEQQGASSDGLDDADVDF